jgi:hypothetical protein
MYADRFRPLQHLSETIDTAPVDGIQSGEVEHELLRLLSESGSNTVAESVHSIRVEVASELQVHVVKRVHHEDREMGRTWARPAAGAVRQTRELRVPHPPL